MQALMELSGGNGWGTGRVDGADSSVDGGTDVIGRARNTYSD